MNSQQALLVSESIASIGVIITCLEQLSRREDYSDDGFMAWRVGRCRDPRLVGSTGDILGKVFSAGGFATIFLARLACALTVFLFAVQGKSPPAVCEFLIVALAMLIVFHCGFGHDGSDQMNTILFVAFAAARAFPTENMRRISLVLVCSQLLLCYFVSGFAKIIARGWRNGFFLPRILITESYGAAAFGRALLRRRYLSVSMSWAVILLEIGFGVVLFLPPLPAAALIASGALMHIGIAVVMGLNSFLWAFWATYPAVLFIRAWISA